MAYIGRPSIVGNFVKLDAISVVNGQAAYTMQNGSANFTDYSSVNQFLVSLNGTIQSPGSSFTVSGSTITFASNLVTNDVIDFIIVFGNSLSSGVPTDATVTTAKIVDANVTTAKVADDAITAAKINNDIISGSTELASEPADTDEFLVSDAGTLKRIDYSYIKPSNDFVLVASADGGGGTVQDFNSCFSSTYQNYMILASISMSSDSTVSMRFQNSSNTELSSGVYYFQGYRTLNNAGSFSHSTSGSFGATSFGPQLVIQAASNRVAGFRIFVYDPYASATKTTYDFQYNCQMANSNLNTVNAGGVYDTAVSMAGFRFNSDAGNFNSVSKFRIYGLK